MSLLDSNQSLILNKWEVIPSRQKNDNKVKIILSIKRDINIIFDATIIDLNRNDVHKQVSDMIKNIETNLLGKEDNHVSPTLN
jgi:hypothetical protein